MKTDLYWIESPWPGRLSISPRPRGNDWLEDEVRGWKQSGADVIASLLTADENADLGLTQEEKLCHAHGLQFFSFPIVDRSVPASRKAAWEFVIKLEALLVEGKNFALHWPRGVDRDLHSHRCGHGSGDCDSARERGPRTSRAGDDGAEKVGNGVCALA